MARTIKQIGWLITVSMLVLGFSSPTWAGWKLDSNSSLIGFSSVKNDSVMEQHTFRHLTGRINNEGDVLLVVDLTSVDTQIKIRDERMKKELFHTDKFPQADIKAKVDIAMLSEMTIGETVVDEIAFSLALHGVTKDFTTTVQLTKLDDDGLLVTTLKPVQISAATFGLDTGIGTLMKIAKLNSILLTVPVSANLVFIPN
ncbi:YceI family protein [Photobacterium nomapromontoriensis]|uniref:YceI family protein n=1 Tax=Photobacterium nomapromontoriensis TaxID=2910237 RepID=UPI003D143E49